MSAPKICLPKFVSSDKFLVMLPKKSFLLSETLETENKNFQYKCSHTKCLGQ